MVKIQENQGRIFVSIPRVKVKRAEIIPGQEVDWEFNERGNLELVKVVKNEKGNQR